jgi:hypothetical protein
MSRKEKKRLWDIWPTAADHTYPKMITKLPRALLILKNCIATLNASAAPFPITKLILLPCRSS